MELMKSARKDVAQKYIAYRNQRNIARKAKTRDVLIAMNGPSYDKFIDSVKPGGIAIIDSTLLTKECRRKDIRSFCIPSTALAAEHGLPGMANIILMGKLLKETGIAVIEAVRPTLEKMIPPKKAGLIEANMKALAIGMEIGRAHV